MIPYFEQPRIEIGPLTIYAFGVFAALGVWIASRIVIRRARTYSNLDPRPLERAIPWALAGGFVGGHWLHVLGYHPELLSSEGVLVLLKFWDGQSSIGGLLGGIAGFMIAFRRARIPMIPYLDALALGVAPGWAIARIGCFFAHDHPGTRTDFPLAVAFPGGARHDLGLYEALVLGTLALIIHQLAKRAVRPNALIATLAIGYGCARFLLDFLRAVDVANADGRLLGLTPAQFVALALIPIGCALLAHGSRRPRTRVRSAVQTV